jgi:hypothetical protein
MSDTLGAAIHEIPETRYTLENTSEIHHADSPPAERNDLKHLINSYMQTVVVKKNYY